MKVAIVGAGISGLACAEGLRAAGISSVLFDKGKRPGGRLSTLRIAAGEWDFGTQYLIPQPGPFADKIAAWHRAGVIAPWPGGPDSALVGVPAMASLVEADCRDHDVRFGMAVQRIDRSGALWAVSGAGWAETGFAAVVLAIPAEQAAPLLSLHDLHLAREAAAVRSEPCWTVMAALAAPLHGAPDWLADRGAVAWAARNNAKPGRGPGECWVIQADSAWSRRHLESAAEDVAPALLAEFAAALGLPALPDASFCKAHRWRFALARPNHAEPPWNSRLRLGACGDWCARPHVAGAWQAGTALAGVMQADLADVAVPAEFSPAH